VLYTPGRKVLSLGIVTGFAAQLLDDLELEDVDSEDVDFDDLDLEDLVSNTLTQLDSSLIAPNTFNGGPFNGSGSREDFDDLPIITDPPT